MREWGQLRGLGRWRACRLLIGGLLIGITLLGTISCSGRATPQVGDSPEADAPKRVLVFVPGITGSVLRDRDQDRVAWGRGRNLVTPHDGGYGIALTIDGSPSRPLFADGILRKIRLLGLRKWVYQPLVDLFTSHGYHLGDLAAPTAQDDLFLYAYDWRQDNVVSARQLFDQLRAVREAHGEESLAVDLVCQSNGGAICRWLARFGSADLAQAEAGTAQPAPELTIHNVVLVGTANGGSLRTLREMTRGRRYVPFFGRRFEPEMFFTITAFFQDLPTYRTDLFVDAAGEPMAVDLFDPASWERYGWGIWSPRATRSLAKRKPPEARFGSPEQRSRHLATMLDRSQRLQAVLADGGPVAAESRYHLIQNVDWETPSQAVLSQEEDGTWHLGMTGDKEIRKQPALHAKITALGDGHATRTSQLHLGAAERAAMVGDVFAVDAGHFETILQPTAHSHLIGILRQP